MKNFDEFLKEGYAENAGYDDPIFIDRYEEVLKVFEQKMIREGMVEVKNLYDKLKDLKLTNGFDSSIEHHYINLFSKLYGKDNKKEEYRAMEDATSKEMSAMFKKGGISPDRYSTIRKRTFDMILMNNCIQKNWESWKKFYQRWLNKVHNLRGAAKLSKYDL